MVGTDEWAEKHCRGAGTAKHVEHYATFNGKIKSPVLTMHTIIDPLVVVANESAYLEIVLAAGRGDRLFQTYTNGNGHCAFTGPQMLTAVRPSTIGSAAALSQPQPLSGCGRLRSRLRATAVLATLVSGALIGSDPLAVDTCS